MSAETPRSRVFVPWISIALAAIMVYVFRVEVQTMNWGIFNEFIREFEFKWTAFLRDPVANLPRLVTHAFLHGNYPHLVSNLVFMALFAPAVEERLGRLMYLVLYLMWGAAAALAQGFFHPSDLGLVGASGAISGAAGAYFVLFPLRTRIPIFGGHIGQFLSKIPAFLLIAAWFLGELKGGFRSLLPDMAGVPMVRVGYWAHVGGFAAGALSMAPFIWGRAKAETN